MSADQSATVDVPSTPVADAPAVVDVPPVVADTPAAPSADADAPAAPTTDESVPVKEARKTKSGGGGKCFEKASVIGLIKAINEDRIAKFMRDKWPALAIKYVDAFAKDDAHKDLTEDQKKEALDKFLEDKKTKDIEAIKFRFSANVHGILENWVSENLTRLETINYFEVPTSYPSLKLKKVYFHRPEFKNFRRVRVEKIKDNAERVIRYAILYATQLTSTYKKITIGKTEINLVLGIITNLVFHVDPPAVVEQPAEPVELLDTAPKKPVKKTIKKVGPQVVKKPKTTKSAAASGSKKPKAAGEKKKAVAKKTSSGSKESAAKRQKTSGVKKSKAIQVHSA